MEGQKIQDADIALLRLTAMVMSLSADKLMHEGCLQSNEAMKSTAEQMAHNANQLFRWFPPTHPDKLAPSSLQYHAVFAQFERFLAKEVGCPPLLPDGAHQTLPEAARSLEFAAGTPEPGEEDEPSCNLS